MFPHGFAGPLIALVPIAMLSTASCSSSVDIKQAVEVTDTGGGWYDAGIVDGKNKIVPMVSFRLRKKGDVDLDSVSINVAFREPPPPGGTTEEEWDEVFLQNVKFTETAQTPVLTVRAEKGYTGDPPQSRLELLKHSQFRDKRAHLFAKASGGQWVEIGTIDVPRQLITR
jgi:hypothetical protein